MSNALEVGFMRSTALVTVSLPQELARQAEKVAKEESRTKSELLREALQLYIDAREARQTITKRQLFDLINQVQERANRESPTRTRSLVDEAVKAVRGPGQKPKLG